MRRPITETGKQTPASASEVDQFLKTLDDTPATRTANDNRGRLVFALDATASRQATWNQASKLQAGMFSKTAGIAALDVQLVYYRGYRECKSSPWLNSPDKLLGMMEKITCVAGKTQIERVLKHTLGETRQQSVNAAVFIGDCVEENPDILGDLAGQLKLLTTPVFVFQEGFDPVASMVFHDIAKLSGGAHCCFNESSADELGRLLNAVAAYTTGGKDALQRLQNAGAREARMLLEQLG